jgi:hypothetical protein
VIPVAFWFARLEGERERALVMGGSCVSFGWNNGTAGLGIYP